MERMKSKTLLPGRFNAKMLTDGRVFAVKGSMEAFLRVRIVLTLGHESCARCQINDAECPWPHSKRVGVSLGWRGRFSAVMGNPQYQLVQDGLNKQT